MSSRRRLVRSLTASLSGGVFPALIGVAATVLANRVGAPSDLVVLLFVWTIVGYLTLTDFGLTRAAASLVANGSAPRDAVARLRRSSVLIGSSLSLAMLLGLALYHGVTQTPVPGVIWAMAPLALLSCVQFPVVGALEASNRFGLLAVVKSGNAVSVYLAPAVLLWWGSPGLAVGVAIIYVWRVGALAWLILSLPRRPDGVAGRQGSGVDAPVTNVRGLLTWLGLSSVLGPLFLYVDRAFVAGVGDQQMWIFYVSCSEILLRTYVIPSSALAVLFPLTVVRLKTHPIAVRRVFGRVLPLGAVALVGAGLVASAVVPLSVLTSLGLPEGQEGEGRVVVALLLAGTFVNWFSQAQIALIQAQGNQRAVVVAQATLIAPYVALLLLVSGAAVAPVAAVWAARIAVLALVLWWLARRPPAATIDPRPLGESGP